MLVELWPFSPFKSQFPQSDSGPIYQWRIPLKSAFCHRMRIIISRRPQTSRYYYYFVLILIKPQDAGPAQSLLCFCGWSVRVWETDHRCWNVTGLDVMRVRENSGTNAWECVTKRSLSVSSQGVVVPMPVEEHSWRPQGEMRAQAGMPLMWQQDTRAWRDQVVFQYEKPFSSFVSKSLSVL